MTIDEPALEDPQDLESFQIGLRDRQKLPG
jgi:hypothetical protein